MSLPELDAAGAALSLIPGESEAAGEARAANPCNLCFVVETPVQMADNTTKRIQDVQVGDQVKSRDPQTGKDEVKTVTSTIERHAPVIVAVALHDVKTGASETLTCTPEHPFFVQGQGWVEAGSLGIGTSIVTRAGPQMAVASVTWQKNKAEELARSGGLGGYTVYNLTVADDHTFFVGNTGGGTWVHNTCVYRSINAAGITQYVGITENFAQRAAAHLKTKGITIQQIPGLNNLSRADARGVEQALIDNIGFGSPKGNGTLINKINSIATSNPIYSTATKKGIGILKGIKYPGF